MDRQTQIEFILDHYENPRHFGRLTEPTVVQKGGNSGCGDTLTFYLQVSDDRIGQIGFEGDGCTISLAAASMAAELCVGKTLAEVEAMPADVILDLLGREIAGTRLKCAMLGLNTVKEAVKKVAQLEPKPCVENYNRN